MPVAHEGTATRATQIAHDGMFLSWAPGQAVTVGETLRAALDFASPGAVGWRGDDVVPLPIGVPVDAKPCPVDAMQPGTIYAEVQDAIPAYEAGTICRVTVQISDGPNARQRKAVGWAVAGFSIGADAS